VKSAGHGEAFEHDFRRVGNRCSELCELQPDKVPANPVTREHHHRAGCAILKGGDSAKLVKAVALHIPFQILPAKRLRHEGQRDAAHGHNIGDALRGQRIVDRCPGNLARYRSTDKHNDSK